MNAVQPTSRRLVDGFLAIVALAAVAAFLWGVWTDDVTLRLATKPVPVACATAFVLLHGRHVYALLVALGLVLSIAGDVLLEIPANLFVPGLIAFLLAHVAYIAAAVSDSRRLALVRALPFVLWCGGVYGVLFSGMGDLAIPVAVYVTVICAMLWRMAATADTRPATWLALGGAVAFALSDSLIAVRKFGGEFVGAREAIILLYWGGQAAIATSTLKR